MADPTFRSNSEPVKRILSSEPLPWAVWLGFCRLLARVRSRTIALALQAPGLDLGPGCIVRGARRISFGRGVHATRNLWLEAVINYQGQTFTPVINIGDHVDFSDGVHISAIERIDIKQGVLMGSRIFIADHNHGLYRGPDQSKPDEPPVQRRLGGGGPVEIGENVWIGDNVVILGPVTIGASAIIAANSVVRHDVPPNTIVAGAPAVPIKRFNPATRCWERS